MLGTYFARDASYAHRFTDQQPRSSRSEDPIALVSSLKSCYGSNGRSVPSMTIDSNDDEILLETTHTNSGDWRRHVHLMFLARVLVGRYTRGKLSYRKPPPMDERKPFGRCFDSCVNYIDDPTLFVISDTSQYYPEYLIQYTNRPKQNAVSLSTKPH